MGFTAAERRFFKKLGANGGKQRAKNLTAEQRSEGARKAVNARWAKLRAAEAAAPAPDGEAAA